MKQKSPFSPQGVARWVVAPLSLAVLAACGGSSGDDPKPEPITQYLLNGQVAVGALVPEANVTFLCAVGGGVGTAVSGTNGQYEIQLDADSVRPCVGEAVIPGGGVMRTVVPGGQPNVTRVNFSPLTDAFVSYLSGSTHKGQAIDLNTLIRDPSATFTRLINSRLGFNSSKAGFEQYVTGNTGISLSGFDFLTSNIVIGQPSDNALEALRGVLVPSDPNDPLSPPVPFLNADGTVSAAGRNIVNFDAPIVLPEDIPACDAPGNSCGGQAGREVVITGGGGT